MEDELKALIKKFMLEKGVGYVWLSASTNHDLTDIRFNSDIQMETDIKDQGYLC